MPFPWSEEEQQDYQLRNSVMREPRSALQQIGDFLKGGRTRPEQFTSAMTGMAPGAILPKGKLPDPIGVTRGMMKIPDYYHHQFGVSADQPFVFGKLADLPVNAKGPWSGFLNPATEQMGVTDLIHAHEPLEDAILNQALVPSTVGFGRIRQSVYPSASSGAEKQLMELWAPETDPLLSRLAQEAQEKQHLTDMFNILERKGLIPKGTNIQTHSIWGY